MRNTLKEISQEKRIEKSDIIEELEKIKINIESVSSTMMLICESIDQGQDIALLVPSIMEGIINNLDEYRDTLDQVIIPYLNK